ncbi:glycosyltransferase family 4 protein [Nocardioides jishulii]|uniref:Glycosyltransferase family 4 protein n=1 Tax=Nocardioides jishulii TaxID=2575440 RepID=A0A4U2YQP6_9ACTN|nr:glycosyltransferase family 4 protein [Nocardioides jishulii]QCX26475.1 glycosyltransferase family 4 protein [Nocardioides jishulii]TKI63719.1 glycosyltransferase family 4 protein [Nocardioides jishulii]
MKIGLLTQWYGPEPGPAALPESLAVELAARGHEVQVVTGFPNYPVGKVFDGYQQSRRLDEERHGVQVRRVALYPSHDDSVVQRGLNYGSFAASALVSGMDALRDVDALWVNYSPVTISLPMFALQRRTKVPTVVHVLDLWPDTVTASGLGGGLGSALEKPLHSLCNRMYASAHRVAYISPGVGEILAQRGVSRDKLAYAPMWADESIHQRACSPDQRGHGLGQDTIALVYAGTLGGAQDLDTLVRACGRVTDLDLRCLIAGSGTEEERLRRLADEVGASNVSFLGRIGMEEMKDLNADSDVHYVGLNDHPLAHITMPSKIQAILAAGRPIVGALGGDAAAAVRDSGGRTVTSGDVDGLVTELRAMVADGRQELVRLQQEAHAYYEQTFSFAGGVDRVEALLTAAAGSRRG